MRNIPDLCECVDRFGCSVKHVWGLIHPTTPPQSLLLSGSAPSWVTGRLEQLPVSGQGGVQKCVLSVVLSSIQSPLRPLMMLWLQTPAVGSARADVCLRITVGR